MQALNLQLESTDTSIKLNACIEIIARLQKLRHKEKEYLIELLNNCYLECKNTEEHNFTATARAYFILGYLKAFLYSKLPLIDPVLKVSLKKKYCLEEITDVDTLKTNYELLNSIYSDSTKTIHSYWRLLSKKIDELKRKVEKYEKYVAVRPTEISYKALYEVIFF